MTGTWITDEEATSPEYWAAHQRHAVRFADNLDLLTAKRSGVLIEVGPGDTLIGLAKSAARSNKEIRLISTTRRAASQSSDAEHWQQTLGELWLAGVKLDWEAVHGDRRPHRTSLPTYPFERQNYWIDEEFGRSSYADAEAESAHYKGPLYKRDDLAQWMYAKSWRSSPTPPPTINLENQDETKALQHWVIFGEHEDELLTTLRTALGTHAVVTSIAYSSAFLKTSESSYTLDPDDLSHYVQLFSTLERDDLWPDHLLYAAAKRLDETPIAVSYQRLFNLGQALQQTGKFAGMALHVLTDRAFDVMDAGLCNATQTPVASLADVLGVELRGLRRRVIDYDASASSPALAVQLMQELRSGNEEDLVAYRGRTRWLSAWENLPLASEATGRTKLRQGGAYILTGGVGGIGLVLAEHLAKTAAAHLVLVGRSPFPAPDTWEQLAHHAGTKPALRDKLQALLRMQAAGGTVDILQADVQDAKRMREVVAHARNASRGLAGIIHAAGVVDYTVIGITEPAAVPRIFVAKAEGTVWIEEAIGAGGLDFAMLCSSISAVIPSVGLCTYAAANAYLDGFAAAHDDRSGTRVISINWDNWSETGMAVDAAAMSKMKSEGAQEVKLGISNEEGGRLFDMLMNVPVSQAAVSTRDLPRLIEKVRAAAKADPAPGTQMQTTSGNAAHPRPELSREYTAAANDVEQGIVEIWQELLALDRVGIHDDFFELGGHSLMGAQVIARIRERFAVSLPLRIIFDSPTPSAIAGLVSAKLLPANAPLQKDLERIEIEI